MSDAAAVLLRLDGLTKSFGRVRVLQGVSLSVREGEVYGFLGRNGAGKTTTIRAIMGIQSVDAGALELLGDRIKRPTPAQKQSLGYVSQEQNFYHWMTCARLGAFVGAFYPGWDDEEFARLLTAFDLPAGRRVSALSGGMKVKLALALALAHRPRLLVLDEPTSGLDPAARREFLEIVRLQARRDGRATFFSSHIVEEVERISDRVGILDRGRVVYEGAIEQLLDEVRRVELPRERLDELRPIGFEVLEEEPQGDLVSVVLRAPAEAWTAQGVSESARRLTLEDAFLALAVGRVGGA